MTYTVTGTKAPFDQITITYVDASGQRRTLRNAYIPWSVTVTPISLSEVGSVEATSMLRLSKLNCSITRSDGTVLSIEQQRRTGSELRMMARTNMADRFVRPGYSPELVDRILLRVCAAIWLALLGMGVAATVALVDLGRGFHQPAETSHTGLLYIVGIGVSALVILAAIPVLLRARQAGAAASAVLGAAAHRPGEAGRCNAGSTLPAVGPPPSVRRC